MKIKNLEFIKFLLVGIINTFVGYTIMFIAYNLFHFSYWISSASNYFFGSICSFILNKHFTFKSKSKSVKELILFVINVIICYAFSYGIARPLVRNILITYQTNIKENIAMLLGSIVFTIMNFVGQKFFVFKNKEKKFNKITINGAFLCRNLTGIERFAYETTARLDSIIEPNKIQIYIPANAKKIPSYKNIEVIKSTKDCKSFPIWDHFTFSKFVRTTKSISLCFANITPLFNPGIVVVHDIYAKVFPQDFTTFKDKLVRFYDCFMYWHSAKHSKLLFTVSEFSKKQISEIYKISEEKIHVIPNGWEHFKSVEPDYSILEKNNLKEKEFYFTLGSLSKRKNLKWIADYAEKHEKQIFAISGKAISGLVPKELEALKTLNNVILLGYVSDGNVKALMQNCRAFVFPSWYEGFGIPPLEALSCNAEIIISDAACLPEIYGNTAHYINPQNTDVDLEKLLLEPVESSAELLKIYSYDKTAEKLYSIMNAELG